MIILEFLEKISAFVRIQGVEGSRIRVKKIIFSLQRLNPRILESWSPFHHSVLAKDKTTHL